MLLAKLLTKFINSSNLSKCSSTQNHATLPKAMATNCQTQPTIHRVTENERVPHNPERITLVLKFNIYQISDPAAACNLWKQATTLEVSKMTRRDEASRVAKLPRFCPHLSRQIWAIIQLWTSMSKTLTQTSTLSVPTCCDNCQFQPKFSANQPWFVLNPESRKKD